VRALLCRLLWFHLSLQSFFPQIPFSNFLYPPAPRAIKNSRLSPMINDLSPPPIFPPIEVHPNLPGQHSPPVFLNFPKGSSSLSVFPSYATQIGPDTFPHSHFFRCFLRSSSPPRTILLDSGALIRENMAISFAPPSRLLTHLFSTAFFPPPGAKGLTQIMEHGPCKPRKFSLMDSLVVLFHTALVNRRTQSGLCSFLLISYSDIFFSGILSKRFPLTIVSDAPRKTVLSPILKRPPDLFHLVQPIAIVVDDSSSFGSPPFLWSDQLSQDEILLFIMLPPR